MQFNILCPATGQLITLPVTPSSYTIGYGKRIETVTLYGLGDYNLQGGTTRATIKVDALFPAQAYPFAVKSPEENKKNLNMLKTWASGKAVLRLIITETDINIPVILENIDAGEKDGTGDVYATLTFRNYVELLVPTFYTQQATATEAAAEVKDAGTTRTVEAQPEHVEEHTVAPGDTLSGICLKYYGDANLYQKLADFNSIANPNLIYDGNKIKIPDKDKL